MIIHIILSATFLYLSFPNYFCLSGWWLFAWVFAIPLFFVLQNRNFSRRFFLCFLWGLIFYSALVVWFVSYSFAGYLFFVLALSTQPIIFACLYQSRFESKLLNMLYVPAAWVAAEYMRTILMQGFSWNLGHSQSFNIYAIQISSLVGSYGVSFVLILFNYCVYKIISERKTRRFHGMSVLITLIIVFGYGYFSVSPASKNVSEQDVVRVCVVQPNINTYEKADFSKVDKQIDAHISLTHESLKVQQPDLIVWPETAIPTDFRNDTEILAKIKQLSVEAQTWLLIGAALSVDGNDYNSAVLLDPRGDVVDVYHKQYLVPFTEYMPGGLWGTGLRDMLAIDSYDFLPGNQLGLFSIDGLSGRFSGQQTFGVGICSEDTIGSLFRKLSRGNAGFVVILLNDGWFENDTALVMHAQNAIMHAVENRIPVLRAANTGWSGYIDEYGRIDKGAELQLNISGFFNAEIKSNRTKTLYNFIGDTLCGLCVCFVIINLFHRGRVFLPGQ